MTPPRNFRPKRPTHTLKVAEPVPDGADAKAGRWTSAGVAWANNDGSLSIHLNPGIVLSWKDRLTIIAFPARPPQGPYQPRPDAEVEDTMPPDPEDTP